jgi:ribosomal protein S18 acetylase RimI-like enzyme
MYNIETIEIHEAPQLVGFIDNALEGMPSYICSLLAKGDQTASDIALNRVQEEDAPNSFKKFKTIRNQGEIASVCCSYRLQSPHAIEDFLLDVHTVWPIPVLQSRARDSWYISAVGTLERWQKEGLASALIEDAEQSARADQAKRLSMIVASENTAAKNLCAKHGFYMLESVPVHPFPGMKHGGDWELMIKEL